MAPSPQQLKDLLRQFPLPQGSIWQNLWWMLLAMGVDTIDAGAGLLPVVGDTIGAFPAVTLLCYGFLSKVPKNTLMAMAAITALDFLFGLTPWVGDSIDALTPATLLNATLLVSALQAQKRINPQEPTPQSQGKDDGPTIDVKAEPSQPPQRFE